MTEKTLWRLLLKTAIGSLALFVVYGSGFNPFVILLAVLIFGAVYLREIEEKKFFGNSFLILPVFALVAAGLTGSAWPFAVFTALFFVLLGLVNLFFKERFIVYGLFNTTFLAALSLFFFFIERPDNFWLSGALFFVAVLLILREALVFFGAPAGRRTTLSAGILALIALEFSYILQFLPLGFINSAVFITLFLILGRETLVSSAKGKLNFSLMMKQVVFFVVLAIFVFAAGGWGM